MELLTRDLPLEVLRLCYADDVCFRGQVQSRALLDAFASVAREDYLGPGPWQFVQNAEYMATPDANPRWLYHDVLFAIDPVRKLNNGQPSAVAGWLQELALAKGERVFHIGCGLGYYTAIIAHVVQTGGAVQAIEVDPDLASRAREHLSPLDNVQVVAGDGTSHDPGEVDAIFVSAGLTHPPALWLDRLSARGRLLLPITVTRPEFSGEATGTGYMLLVERRQTGFEANFVSMVGIYSSLSGRDPVLNQLLGPAFRETLLGKREPVRSLRRDVHTPDPTCWLHAEDVCFSSRSL